MTVTDRVEQIAFAMLHLSPEDRERSLQDAFDHMFRQAPDVTEIPVAIVNFIAAVYRRLADLATPGWYRINGLVGAATSAGSWRSTDIRN